MTNQKGGVKKRYPGKPPQNILHDTLESAGVVLNVISDSSLKSFVLEIIINDPAAREYIDTDELGRFNNPVERLVMKILITTPNGSGSFTNEYVGIDGVSRTKASETPADIITEAGVQQEAWIKTVVNGRVPVCPSVADLIFFDNQNGINFITYLQTNFATGNARMDRVCRYILDKLRNINQCGICVMVMPEVSAPAQVLAPVGAAAAPPQASITLDGFLRLADNTNFQGLTVDQTQKNRAYSLITACVMRLYWAGIIDFDLHENNFILYVDQNVELQGKIIDLGNAIIFTNGTNKFIPDVGDIEFLKLGLDTYKNSVIDEEDDDTKEEFVVDLLDMIKRFDTKGNHRVFPGTARFAGQDDHTNCQMGWWQTIKDKDATAAAAAGTDHSFSEIIDDAYDIARDGFMVDIDARNPGVSYETIQRYIREGGIPSFDEKINPVMAVWPLPAPPGSQGAQSMVVGPGGGARKKTSKKRKFRKNKTKRLALRKTKSKKRRRTSKK
jgi:DNA-binding phage protein